MEVSIDFESITNQIYITYLNNLVKVCEKNNINKEELYKKIEDLHKKKEDQISETKIAIKKNQSNVSLSNLSNVESPTPVQYNDDYLYQKPWTKLTAIHKIIKIKEFVNQLLINDAEELSLLKDKLVDMVKNKILTKKEAVNYDSIKCKIISITHLQYKNGKYFI